jgi:hypothetical protein
LWRGLLLSARRRACQTGRERKEREKACETERPALRRVH